MSEHGDRSEHGGSFLSALLKKLAYTKEVESVTGDSTKAAQDEVMRQIKQAMNGGDPVRGRGVTKSGEED